MKLISNIISNDLDLKSIDSCSKTSCDIDSDTSFPVFISYLVVAKILSFLYPHKYLSILSLAFTSNIYANTICLCRGKDLYFHSFYSTSHVRIHKMTSLQGVIDFYVKGIILQSQGVCSNVSYLTNHFFKATRKTFDRKSTHHLMLEVYNQYTVCM